MYKRLFLIACFLIFLGFIRCGCPDTNTYIVDWKSIKLKTVRYSETNSNDYYSFEYTSDSVFHGPTYGFNLYLLCDVKVSQSTGVNVDFSNSALAMKCDGDYFTPRKKAISFDVQTLENFDDQHLSNSDLTEYFTDEYMFIDNILYFLNETSPGGYSESRFTLRLHEIPTIDSIHQFRVNITLEDSTVLTMLTQKVKLLP